MIECDRTNSENGEPRLSGMEKHDGLEFAMANHLQRLKLVINCN